ncbi:hypothetical protein [Corynebacterium urinipleomorphum]|uniref:hypothetical protein n=1 Tax=Corynebacterium urinipleomorphum TaxID=1852380 RepID=UPI000B354071|nr:hypothetical protein [Corynebacterium urinipleomorphum]
MVAQVGSFPHPVIGNGDDVSSSLHLTNIGISPTVEDILIKFKVFTDDQQLQELVNSGQAKIVIWWHCRATLSSGILEPLAAEARIDGWRFECSLDQEFLRDRVDIVVEITAAQDIENFRWDNQHEDYGGQKFSIRVADYLAFGGDFYFNAAKLYDAMNPPLGSIFRITKREDQVEPIRVDFNNTEQISVFLSAQVFDGLQALGYADDLKLSLVVLPVLMETLSYISRMEAMPEGDDFAGREWYQTLKRMIEHSKLDISSPLESAERLLNHTTAKALASLEQEENEE